MPITNRYLRFIHQIAAVAGENIHSDRTSYIYRKFNPCTITIWKESIAIVHWMHFSYWFNGNRIFRNIRPRFDNHHTSLKNNPKFGKCVLCSLDNSGILNCSVAIHKVTAMRIYFNTKISTCHASGNISFPRSNYRLPAGYHSMRYFSAVSRIFWDDH